MKCKIILTFIFNYSYILNYMFYLFIFFYQLCLYFYSFNPSWCVIALKSIKVDVDVLFTRPTHSGHCLLRLQALDTEPYDIFSKSSYNDTQFKYRFRCTQPLRSKYAIIIFIYRKNHPIFPLNCYPPVRLTNISNALS